MGLTARTAAPETPGRRSRSYGRRALPFDPIAEASRHWRERVGEPGPMAAVTSIMRAQQILLGEVDAILRPFGLSFARYEAMVLLTFSRRGSLPMSRMGERLMVHPTSVTNAVDRLEQDGLVLRVAHPTDRRTTLVEITAAGRSLAARATEALTRADFGLRGLDAHQAERLTELLALLRRAAGDWT
jgi:DNA-binding MarR family transcriptional regulator